MTRMMGLILVLWQVWGRKSLSLETQGIYWMKS